MADETERPDAESGEKPGFLRRVRELPLVWKVAAGALALVLVGAASLSIYRTYDYVQHDNQFCMSCHIMEQPFEQFARSAHRDLSCKACHQPTFFDRSQMALTQVIEQPDSIAVHAEVPNERCAECHIEGDPERWRHIKNTVGHRVHLESDEADLEGLQCVECHSTSVHEFAPTRRTCGQAGCHDDVRVELGDMGNVTVHCVVCHDFTAPAADADTVADELRPQREECLSCHRMRERVAIPENEPHGANCATCHDPHTQTEPAQALATCTESGCHASPDTLSSFHHQAEGVRLERCTQCHTPHEFRAREENCLECHADIVEEWRSSAASEPASAERASPEGREGIPLVARLASAAPGPGGLAALGVLTAAQARDTLPRFRHDEHVMVDCQVCHNTGEATTPSNPRFCQSCHHRRAVASGCASCHRPDELARREITVRRTMELSVPSGGERTLPFPHETHAEVGCTQCHTDPPALSAEGVACAECHEEHHAGVAVCSSCHVAPPDSAHPLETHVTCTGSGCHASIPFEEPPRSRPVCETCHRSMTDHRVGRDCVTCHVLPAHPTSARGHE